ncbi:MAG: hypothetical protein EPN93_13655 [Spirochaetes bacterium]|nr:MAG: hypothetical protein EPN93_13655 [Spirochaetota bacterium]
MAFEGRTSGYRKPHHKDEVAFSRGGKTVVPGAVHRHSLIDGSPLGPKALAMTPELAKKTLAVVEKAFAKAK